RATRASPGERCARPRAGRCARVSSARARRPRAHHHPRGGSMASLLELTSQGDVGTIADESKLSEVKLMDPQELYELWERQQWQSHTIDFAADRRDWETMDAETRERLAWNLS